MDDGGTPGRLLIIGGGQDRCCGAGLLERFVELCGGGSARIVLVTTATGRPDQEHADYERVFRKLGVDQTIQLRLHGRADADGDAAAAVLTDATGVFFTGGDQSRLRTLVGSRANDLLRERLSQGLIVGGTSAGATASSNMSSVTRASSATTVGSDSPSPYTGVEPLAISKRTAPTE